MLESGIQGSANTDGKTPNLHDELRERLSSLHRESTEERTFKDRGRRNHLLVDRLSSEGPRGATEKQTDFETFFARAPKINPARALIKGVVCGVRAEDIKEPTMREIRYLDKLIDELAKGRAMDKILRKE
jgi:hypothetical protein